MKSKLSNDVERASERELTVLISNHALMRINKRFSARGREEIKRVFRDAMEEGTFCRDSRNVLVQHGSLVLIGVLEGDVFTVKTVYNLSRGVAKKLKDRLGETSSPLQRSPKVLFLEEASAR